MSHICYLCGSTSYEILHQGVRDRKDVDVFKCRNCGLVCLSSFDHINDQFYEDSQMLGGTVNLSQYRKKSFQDDLRRFNMLSQSITDKNILDFGCGAGGFLKLAIERARNVEGLELDATIRKALNEMDGIRTYRSIEDLKSRYDLITMFHVLEHLPDPKYFLNNLRDCLELNGQLIIEVPNADDALLTLYRSSHFADFTYWSCHLYLYTAETLRKLAESCGYMVKYVKQIQRYPLSNHLYWLSHQQPGGHQIWELLNSSILNEAYEQQLAGIGKCDTIIACLVAKE